jgi:hypothetical protein
MSHAEDYAVKSHREAPTSQLPQNPTVANPRPHLLLLLDDLAFLSSALERFDFIHLIMETQETSPQNVSLLSWMCCLPGKYWHPQPCTYNTGSDYFKERR